MSQAKPCIIYLEARMPDGRRFGYESKVLPTGSSDIHLASFWMLLQASLIAQYPIARVVEVDSSRRIPQRKLEF